MRYANSGRALVASALFIGAVAIGCSDSDDTSTGGAGLACDAEPVVLTTSAGVEFVRTPDSCFANLPGWTFEPKYVEIDGLRQAYVDEGTPDGPVVLLLHGQPSWSYLYRKMIPVLADAGFRVIAMDHLGMGRSDKPTEVSSYSYLGHNERLQTFIEQLDLRDINLFVQDWGSLIGLRIAGLNPDRFARIAVGNGDLPQIPASVQPFPPVENPDVINNDLVSPFAAIPAQQVPFYDGCEAIGSTGADFTFGDWIVYAMTAAAFRPSEVIEAITWFDLSDGEEAAYDAPFPSRIYMGGPRTFPSLVNQTPGTSDEAWQGLRTFTKPFITIWAANDPGNLGRCDTQDNLICSIPGAQGQAHVRLPQASHFLQDDQGAEIANRLITFIRDQPATAEYQANCAPPVAPDGTGTACMEDADCSALTANSCLTLGAMGGICSIEGCAAGGCASAYLCCRDCNPAVASMLPFDGSACLPEQVAPQLAGAGCTCD